MGWLALPVLAAILAGLAYGLWPRPSAMDTGGFDAVAVLSALTELDGESVTVPDLPAAPVSFPRDHGAHPEARAELWELSALLRDADENPIAVRFSLARLGLARGLERRRSALAANAVFAGELAVIAGGELKIGPWREQRVSRAARGLAGAGPDETGVERVWIEQWVLSREAQGSLLLRAEADGLELELGFSPVKQPVVVDQQGLAGSPAETEARSLALYSQPRLSASGSLRAGAIEKTLHGLAWLDHGWGAVSDALSGGRGQLVANRFQLQLEDGSELACLHLRRRGGGGTPIPSCVLIGVDGEQLVLRRRDLTLAPAEAGWVRHGGVEYPMGWRLLIPARELELTIEPLFADALSTPAPRSTTPGSAIWRGAVDVTGWRGADAIRGQGRMDLNGYHEAGRVGT
jgi:predicted secreted hydrolase